MTVTLVDSDDISLTLQQALLPGSQSVWRVGHHIGGFIQAAIMPTASNKVCFEMMSTALGVVRF